ncbi:anti-sigma factor [Terriglobus tenax]|uniref:hypothetical protein n=1 Tax=Terriglobus tenax TaxID=1111115 RepID=UPI0021DFA3E4|nr:hypothetical protein [Terriglobus tenax]
MNCHEFQNELEDLVLNPAQAPSPVAQAHLSNCDPCSAELKELRATFAAMDAWTAPEPSPWFDTRVTARVRAEQQSAPANFLERLRARLLYNTGAQFRPMMATAMALVLMVGGAGTYLASVKSTPAPRAAVVEDLQILDRNDQAIQEMDLLDDASQDDEGIPQT